MSRIQKSVTPLDQLDSKPELHLPDEEKDVPLRSKAIDLFRPLANRLQALIELDSDEVCETISTLTGMYQFSQTQNLEEYVSAIARCTQLPLVYRIDCAQSLPSGLAYEIVHSMFVSEGEEMKRLPTPVRVKTVTFLMNCIDYREDARTFLCEIVLDTSINCLYRFKTIQSLETHFLSTNSIKLSRRHRVPVSEIDPSRKELFLYYTQYALQQFIDFQDNLFTYRILACQFMFEKCEPTLDLCTFCDKFLLEVASQVDLSEDVRADACDVILQYGADDTRDTARRLLFVLGGGEQTRNNVYKNSQNVHIRAIEESVQKIVDRLSTFYPPDGKNFDFVEIQEKLLDRFKDHPDMKNSLEGALTRISIDRAVYGHSNMSLITILCKLWTYIQHSEFRESLESRLIEELIESNNKCSSGYAGRLVNTLSGFDADMTIRISFEDQIIANLEARLNTRIRQLEDVDLMSQVLDEMTIPVIEFDKRSHFLRFFRENISKIREEMYSEFCTHMDDTDYDFYFRKAIIHYEGCY